MRKYTSLTNVIHRTQYPAIDPTNPANSAAGKVVAISGGASGIGYAIARGFCKAGAATIILLARRQEALDEGAAKLQAEIAALKANTAVWTYLLDIREAEDAKAVFDNIRKRLSENGASEDVDILVTSAARLDQGTTALDFGPQAVSDTFDTNVSGNLNVVRAFLAPELPAIPLKSLIGTSKDTTDARAPGREKIVLDVSSGATYLKLPGQALYSASKLGFTSMMQHLQTEVDQLPGSPIRIHSFNPGLIFSPANQKLGMAEGFAQWDDESLPEGFAVWLASPAAAFLKGRFVWSSWDIPELLAMRQKFEEDREFCQFTLKL